MPTGRSNVDDLLRRLGLVLPDPSAAPPMPRRSVELPIPARVGDIAVPPPAAVASIDDAARAMDAGAPAAPDFDLGSDLWTQMSRSSRAHDNIARAQTGNLRNQDLARIAADNINESNAAARRAQQPTPILTDGRKDAMAAAGLVGATGLAGTGAYMAGSAALDRTRTPDAITDTGGTAELANESRPVPEVQPAPAPKPAAKPTKKEMADNLSEQEFTDTFKQQYQARDRRMQEKGQGGYADPSARAKAILDDLNARRRKAGGEVPEAKQMIAEANSLLALSNQQRNAPGYKPRNASDPREQAQMLLQKLNADRMEAGGEVPHAAKVMAEVRRLQAEGDNMRWGGK